MRLGIDLGGTKIEIIALGDDGRVLARRRVTTPQGDYPATVRAVVELVAMVEAQLAQRGTVGVGTPGALSRATGRIKNANSTCLNGRPLLQDLQAALDREVRIANDANCFAISEAADGAAAGAEVVFGVILGTGVGGGIVVRGQPLTGPNSIAGEWGHNPLPLPTGDDLPLPPCYCGRSGCIETYLSGPGLAADHQRNTGQALTPAEIATRATDDPVCEATLQRYEARLARALAGVINLLDPDVIVLGGGLSKLERLYKDVPRLWTPHVFSDRVDTRLVKNRHGDSSGVRGAAWLWPVGGRAEAPSGDVIRHTQKALRCTRVC
jgi:fructokinase